MEIANVALNGRLEHRQSAKVSGRMNFRQRDAYVSSSRNYDQDKYMKVGSPRSLRGQAISQMYLPR